MSLHVAALVWPNFLPVAAPCTPWGVQWGSNQGCAAPSLFLNHAPQGSCAASTSHGARLELQTLTQLFAAFPPPCKQSGLYGGNSCAHTTGAHSRRGAGVALPQDPFPPCPTRHAHSHHKTQSWARATDPAALVVASWLPATSSLGSMQILPAMEPGLLAAGLAASPLHHLGAVADSSCPAPRLDVVCGAKLSHVPCSGICSWGCQPLL